MQLNDIVQVELTNQQLTYIINTLAQRPYREVAPLIQQLAEQQQAQLSDDD